jgi:hypothetical protein
MNMMIINYYDDHDYEYYHDDGLYKSCFYAMFIEIVVFIDNLTMRNDDDESHCILAIF